MPRGITVGAAQAFITGDVRKNLRCILSFVKEAKQRGVQVLVFPECMLSGYGPKHWEAGPPAPRALNEAMREAAAQAKRHLIALAGGTSDRQRGKWYNVIHFIDQTGRRIGRYAKVHLTGGDAKVYAPGQGLRVVRWRGIRFGMQICLDMRYPETWRLLRLKGAEVILHSVAGFGTDAWKVPVLEGTLRCRAAENGLFIVSANCAGPIQIVASAIVDGRGLLLAQANREVEELITARIDFSRPRHTFEKDRRTDFYALKDLRSGRAY